ncbi:DUF7146 domain-containing protein [Paracoccus onubensis]|uniref:Virulence-associated protein E n=1 Tax=Paracoccus onubensis TaxID=1675788 RepID=A0A418SWW6_9RHOB|nr:toprim domain-containing protein [Paracoccus onubensis]RJE85454.1 virulence-associated protein E [Paracoccus onubensis]
MTDAERITKTLGGDWRGGSGLAPCPICQPEGRRDQRALSLTDRAGALLTYCHKGGCAVWPELKRIGLTDGTAKPAPAIRSHDDDPSRQVRWRKARELFAESIICEGTPAQTYLEARGIIGLRFSKLQRSLRFHPEAFHAPTGQRLPAMIAQIRSPKGHALGVHRTFLAPDGSGKADVICAKMMLGPSRWGAVRFGPDAPVIALAEGIETALSVSRASRLTVWACLSTSGMKAVVLPPLPAAAIVVICADHDPAGLSAAEDTAKRLEAEGRAVSIIHPQTEGEDFNDILRGNS